MPFSLLDFFFPKTSLTGTEGVWVTEGEMREMRGWPIRVERGELEKRGLHHLDRIVAASSYDHSALLRTAVHRFKYGRVSGLDRALGTMLERVAPFLAEFSDSVLCPVPLHWTRRFSRGFNQSHLLAEVVGRSRGWQVLEMLRRVRITGHQAWRKRDARLSAVRGAFVCAVETVPPHIVLVDDIATTGATLDACAEELKKHGARFVEALVIAQG